MGIPLLIAAAALLLIIILLLVNFLKSKEAPSEIPTPNAPNRRIQNENRPNNTARQRFNRNARQETNDEDSTHSEIDAQTLKKIGSKKLAKLQAKADKKAQRSIDEELRIEKQKKDETEAELRKKEEQLVELEEQKRLEQERIKREEEERRKEEEYNQMKLAFVVEEEGFEEKSDPNDYILQDFINYVQSTKCVVIEELACKYKMKTDATINRLEELTKSGVLSGFFDDRGKYIFVSNEEFENIAKFIRQRGRISLTELCENSSKLISIGSSANI